MAEEPQRQARRAVGDGLRVVSLEQRAHVGDHCGIAGRKQRLQLRHTGMHAVIAAVRRGPGQRQQRALLQREVGTYRLVLGKLVVVGRHQHVVGIVAARQQYADQRPVVGCALGGGRPCQAQAQ